MSIEQNKELVTKTWEAFVKGDMKTAFSNMSDQVSWLVPGNIPKVSGLHKGKDGIIAFLSAIGPVVPNGMQTEIRRLYGDGDTVVVELTNRANTAKGRDYENEYCFVFEIEGGKIRRVREYTDTAKAKAILFD
jgi:ketosteroid isomerase-like protein